MGTTELFGKVAKFKRRCLDLQRCARIYAGAFLALGALLVLYWHASVEAILLPWLPAIVALALSVMFWCDWPIEIRMNRPELQLAFAFGLPILAVILIMFRMLTSPGSDVSLARLSTTDTSPVAGASIAWSPWNSDLSPDVPASANPLGITEAGIAFRDLNETAGLLPTDRYQWSFRTFVVESRWSGDLIVHANGAIERLDVVQAQHDSRLRDLPLFPRELAMGEFKGYENANQLVKYDYEYKTDIPRSQNEHEYEVHLLRGPQGLYWVIPFFVGPSRDALFVVDARTGEAKSVAFHRGFVPSEVSLLGVQNFLAANPSSASSACADHLTYQGIKIEGTHIYWRWSCIENGQLRAAFMVDGQTLAVQSVVPQ